MKRVLSTCVRKAIDLRTERNPNMQEKKTKTVFYLKE